ncbi:MAG: class I SAM-dependent methyltransferase [Rhizobiaceae bacterium]|nr:class I SAM-dependent methyltransferase [Rhizobiaceae bacterium]
MSSDKISKASGQATNDLVLRIVGEATATGPKRILDLGCGSGYTLELIADLYRKRGWDPSDYLLGVDIDLSSYAASVPSRHIDLNEPLDASPGRWDIVLSIEVLEHSRRPYMLLSDIRRVLEPGGLFLFSVPNPGNMSSRLKYFLYGHHHMFYGPSDRIEDAGRLCGHINPLAIHYWDYGLRYAGFADVDYLIDRRKKGSMALSILFYPLLALGTALMHRHQKGYSQSVYDQNRRVLGRVNHMDTLAGRTLVFVCRT